MLDADLNLVIVAAAGNDSLDGVAFPAAVSGVISVGATNLAGKRTVYSSYGGRLDLGAPGGEIAIKQHGGILTTGSTWLSGFWQGIEPPKQAWATSLDPQGQGYGLVNAEATVKRAKRDSCYPLPRNNLHESK